MMHYYLKPLVAPPPLRHHIWLATVDSGRILKKGHRLASCCLVETMNHKDARLGDPQTKGKNVIRTQLSTPKHYPGLAPLLGTPPTITSSLSAMADLRSGWLLSVFALHWRCNRGRLGVSQPHGSGTSWGKLDCNAIKQIVRHVERVLLPTPTPPLNGGVGGWPIIVIWRLDIFSLTGLGNLPI